MISFWATTLQTAVDKPLFDQNWAFFHSFEVCIVSRKPHKSEASSTILLHLQQIFLQKHSRNWVKWDFFERVFEVLPYKSMWTNHSLTKNLHFNVPFFDAGTTDSSILAGNRLWGGDVKIENSMFRVSNRHFHNENLFRWSMRVTFNLWSWWFEWLTYRN